MDNIPTRLNNPGSLKDPNTGTFRQFNSPQEGYSALLNDLQAKKEGRTVTGLGPNSTLVDFAKAYAPASDKNNPAQYAANIANHMKVRPDAPISSLDVGKWADAVAHSEGYQGATQPTQQTPIQSTPQTKESKPGFIQSLVQGAAQPFLKVASSGNAILNAANPEEYKKIMSQGTDFGYFGKATPVGAGFDVTKGLSENIKPILSAAGTGAELASYALPVKGVKQAMAAGATMGAGTGLEQTGTIEGGVKGGLLGGALGLAGGGVSKILESLPKSLTETAFKGLSPEQVAQVLKNKTMGSADSLLAQSQKSISKGGAKIDSILRAVDPSVGKGANSIRDTLVQFPEFNKQGGVDKMLGKIQSLISNSKNVGEDRATIIGYMNKIADGTASLWEKNKVRSAIDSATQGGYAKLAKAVSPSAGHDLAMTFADALRNEVKTNAPGTVPFFDELAKEMGIRKIIGNVAKKKAGGIIRWSDIIPFMGGSALAGPLGGIGGVLAERAANNPAVQFGAAKAIQGLGKATSPLTQRAGLLSTLQRPKDNKK